MKIKNDFIPMTEEYAKDLVALLPEHSGTLAAFYDDGVRRGMKLCRQYAAGCGIGLLAVAGAISIGVLIGKGIKEKQEKKNP